MDRDDDEGNCILQRSRHAYVHATGGVDNNPLKNNLDLRAARKTKFTLRGQKLDRKSRDLRVIHCFGPPVINAPAATRAQF